jgi:PAS domain S-box-containing protein
VEHLRRLQSLARFFAAPGPRDTFADRFACVVGQALGAAGAALVHREGSGIVLDGLWRISARNARAQVPAREVEWDTTALTPSTRKGTQGMWLPLGERLQDWGVVAIFSPPFPGPKDEELTACLSLAADGLAARLSADAKALRSLQSDRALSSLRGALLKIDGEDRVAMANPATAALLGLTPGSVEGRPMRDVFARDPHLPEMMRSFRRPGAGEELETYVTRPSGQTIPLSIRASLVGEGESVLALLFDLSRRKEVEAEMRRAERLASLGRLSAGVAHEIRNPLAGIRTTSELLRSRLGSDDERLRFIDVILEETQRLDRIVGSLLQFAKPAEPKLERIDLGLIVERSMELACGKAAEHRVSLKKSPWSPCSSLADRDQILQVVLNLILNAIEATPPGGEVRVSIDMTRAKGALLVRIEDGGEGVPFPLRDRIFDPFFTTKAGGTGLGLSISEHIVRRHGGSIRLEKPEGGASTAILSLPQNAPSSAGGAPWPTS